eukprot:g80147.t1
MAGSTASLWSISFFDFFWELVAEETKATLCCKDVQTRCMLSPALPTNQNELQNKGDYSESERRLVEFKAYESWPSQGLGHH